MIRGVAGYGKGTKARSGTETPDGEEVLGKFTALPEKIETDYRAGKFIEYKALQIGPNTIESVEEAVAFHCFHEGLHIGMIITLKNLLGRPTEA